MRRHSIRGLKAHDIGWVGGQFTVLWAGLSALALPGDAVTHGVAMGWHDAGPLALKSVISYSGIQGPTSDFGFKAELRKSEHGKPPSCHRLARPALLFQRFSILAFQHLFPSRPECRIVVLGGTHDFFDGVFGDEVAVAGTAFDSELGEVERADEVAHAQGGPEVD